MSNFEHDRTDRRARMLALTAALLGWMFDGFEMGLFPVVARTALSDLLATHDGMDPAAFEALVGKWNGIAIAGFLIGAAAGGVLFGWLGDRIGRVRAMSFSILTYALVSGLGAYADSAWQIVLVRFVAALGMGGEWSLGVALVMEVWGGRSRALLAGLIGAAANAGFAIVALLSLGLSSVRGVFAQWGFSESWVEWRLLMLCGVLPALLTLFVRLYVPESRNWEREKREGTTSAWATRDLIGVLIGVIACGGIIFLWSQPISLVYRLIGTLPALVIVCGGYLYPAMRYLARSSKTPAESNRIVRRMLLGAVLSGIPLLATWASVQWAPMWADQLSEKLPGAKAYTQFWSATGAIGGGFLGALLGGYFGRRVAYVFLCFISFGSVWVFFSNTAFGTWFLISVFVMGGCTAAFYGWLPLYLPELFPTKVRATGQGFSYNFGRIIAAIGAMQTGAYMGTFSANYPRACTFMSSIYFLGVLMIWLAPETKGESLPA